MAIPNADPPKRRAIGLACAMLWVSAPLLGGCAAAVAVPVLAAGGVLAGGKDRRQDSADRPAAVSQEARALETATSAILLPITELPPPTPEPIARTSVATDNWRSFADYALDRNKALSGAGLVESALLEPGGRLEQPDRMPCTKSSAAVIIDLDQGKSAFMPASGAQPAPVVAENLARLRAAGIVVMWASDASANRVTEIGDVLRSSGLDPTGKDPLLLARGPDERKQVMRMEANRTDCVVAVAGDRRGDFDELFDYLRSPDLAAGLDIMLGDGWFLVPPLFGPDQVPSN